MHIYRAVEAPRPAGTYSILLHSLLAGSLQRHSTKLEGTPLLGVSIPITLRMKVLARLPSRTHELAAYYAQMLLEEEYCAHLDFSVACHTQEVAGHHVQRLLAIHCHEHPRSTAPPVTKPLTARNSATEIDKQQGRRALKRPGPPSSTRLHVPARRRYLHVTWTPLGAHMPSEPL